MIYFYLALLFWIVAWGINVWISRQKSLKILNIIPPILFGASILLIWEATIFYFSVSPVILPPPSAIFFKLITSVPMLWADFVQTVIKGALSGYIIGCGSAIVVALVVDLSLIHI